MQWVIHLDAVVFKKTSIRRKITLILEPVIDVITDSEETEREEIIRDLCNLKVLPTC